jgi:hypothetical protein
MTTAALILPVWITPKVQKQVHNIAPTQPTAHSVGINRDFMLLP